MSTQAAEGPLDTEARYWRDQWERAQEALEHERERYTQLEALLKENDERWPDLGIPRAQETLLRVLYRREVATKEMLYHALYSERPDSDLPEQKIIDVQICKLRQNLPDADIQTSWGRGYYLSPKGREWLKAKVEGAQ
ncbi:winged helix-turn-helix domain-containing protein [Methyloceanibacter caenitepidi]